MTRTTLPIHPSTGLTALGLRRDGRPIWPVLGGDGTTEPPAPTADPPADPPVDPPADPPKTDDQLGDPGKKALAEERAAKKAAEKELAAARAKLKEFEDRDKTESEKSAERLAAAEKVAADATAKLLRLEVAGEKGLTPAQAKRLIGTTRDELEADADQILLDFPVAAAPVQPKAPAPDPSQGAKGKTPPARAASLSEAVTSAMKPKA